MKVFNSTWNDDDGRLLVLMRRDLGLSKIEISSCPVTLTHFVLLEVGRHLISDALDLLFLCRLSHIFYSDGFLWLLALILFHTVLANFFTSFLESFLFFVIDLVIHSEQTLGLGSAASSDCSAVFHRRGGELSGRWRLLLFLQRRLVVLNWSHLQDPL